VICEIIVPKYGRLAMGNELLSDLHGNYSTDKRYQVSDHTFMRIYSLFNTLGILPPLD
jgi:hypothetical protein